MGLVLLLQRRVALALVLSLSLCTYDFRYWRKYCL